MTVTDTLPVGLTATSLSGTGWTCTLATLTCTSTANILAGGSGTAITLVASIATSAVGTLVNNALVAGGSETNTTNDAATDSITVTGLPDLTIAKSHAGTTFNPGGTVTFTLTPSNSGTVASSGTVTVTDTLPAGLTATSISGTGWTCAALPTLSCTSTTPIAVSGSGTPLTLVASIGSSTTGTLVNNTAVACTCTETNLTNNTASDSITVTGVTDLTIAKTHAGTSFTAGGSVTFTLTPSNSGTGASSGTVTVTDTLPAGLTATSISGTGWTCAALPTLSCTSTTAIAVGASASPLTLVASIATSASGTLVNNTAVACTCTETSLTNNTASDSITVTAAPPATLPDLTLTKTHAGTTFVSGDSVTFTLTPNNIGTAATSGTVTLTDTLPAGLTATAISGGAAWTCTLAPLACTSTASFTAIAAPVAPATLVAGTQVITLVAAIGASTTGTLVNNATVGGGGETNTTNDSATDSITVTAPAPPPATTPDLTLSKTHTGTTFTSGGSVVFTLTPNNIGTAATSGTVTLTDTLPTGLTATSISGGAAWTCTLSPLACSSTASFTAIPAPVAPATSVAGTQPITLVASIGAATTGTLVNNATVGGGGETNTTNDSATDSIAVTGIPDLTLTKTHTGSAFEPGGTVTFTLTPNNVGAATTSGTVTVTDRLPAGLTATSISGGAPWTCVLATLACTSTSSFTAIAAGAAGTQPITLVASIGPTATGTLVNNATVGGGGETNVSNNSATDSITLGVTGLPDLTLTKTHLGTTFVSGGRLTYTLTVSNVGAAPSSGTVTVTDSLPAGLTPVSISGGAAWTCTLAPVSCSSTSAFGSLAPGTTSNQPITLVVAIGASVTGTILNSASVGFGGETNVANDLSSDPVVVAVPGPIVVSGCPTPPFTEGVPGSQQVGVSGGTGFGYGYVVIGGALPPGLTISASGLIVGTPTVAGNYTATIQATDASANSGSTACGIPVAASVPTLPEWLTAGLGMLLLALGVRRLRMSARPLP